MDVPTQNSGCLPFQDLQNAYSCKRCSFFVSIFFLFVVLAIGIVVLVVIFIIRPREPEFSLETIKVDSFKLHADSNSTLVVSSSSVSLKLNSQNHNKFGIKYSSSNLILSYKDVPMGLIRVPRFYQPAHSHNINVTTTVFLHCLNVSQILDEGSSRNKNMVQMKILGNIRFQLKMLHLTLPKIKVALECDIQFDYSKLAIFKFKDELFTIKVVEDHAAFFNVSQSFSKNCTAGIYL